MGLDGNRLGPKSKYIYNTDVTNVAYILTRDEDLAVAGVGSGTTAPVEFDPANPPSGVTLTPPPKRFEPRGVYVEDPLSGARKFLVCFSADASLYAATSATSITIDSLAFTSTGRKGESLTF